MTNAEQTQVEEASDAGASVPDKQLGAPIVSSAEPVSGDDPVSGDEPHRRLAIFSGVLMCLLGAPYVLPAQGSLSLWEMTERMWEPRWIFFGIFGWPALLGLLGIVRGLLRHKPGRLMLIAPSIITLLCALGTTGLMCMLLWSVNEARESLLEWVALFSALAALLMLARSRDAAGWHRFNHCTAAVALLFGVAAFGLAGSEAGVFVRPALGPWLSLIAVTALLPFVVVTMTARRN